MEILLSVFQNVVTSLLASCPSQNLKVLLVSLSYRDGKLLKFYLSKMSIKKKEIKST